MTLTKPLLAALSALILGGCSSLPGAGPEVDKTYRLTILHTNDHHGRFWRNSNGEGGMAARKTLIDRIRAEVKESGGHVLLLDAGDVNTGVPESDLQDAVPDFRGMNLMGYNAMAVGNHEFDKPLSVLRMQRELAKFPLISANVYENGKRMFDPYVVFNLGGLRVGVMGLTTSDTPKLVSPDIVKGLEFRSVIEEASKVVPELRAKADVIIAASHAGYYQDGNSGTQSSGDVEIARAVKGIDAVVGGHSHDPVCMKSDNVIDRAYVPGSECRPDRQNGAWIMQAHEWGKYLGRADFAYRNGVFTLLKYELLPINLKRSVRAADGKTSLVNYTAEIPEDKEMLDLLKPFQEFGEQKLNVEIGSVDGRLEGDRGVVRARPASMGILIGRALMDKTKADFAVVNSGGVRDSLAAGKLTYKDVLKVQPFGNTTVTVDLTGTEVMAYLNAAAKMSVGSGAFPQFTGVNLVITGGVVTSASIKGAPVDPARTYRMVINNFMAAGGDGYPRLTGHRSFVDTGFVDADLLRAYISANSPLKAADYAPGDAVVRR
jgi:5'-nucleotidase/UDP-sugar diphosphatase